MKVKKMIVPMLMGVLMAFAIMPMTAAVVFAQDSSPVDTGIIVIEQPAAISVVEKDKGVPLCFKVNKDDDDVSYQWFQSTDGTLENSEAIEGATDDSLETGSFEEKDIRYYFCVATAGEESVVSDVAAVAYTGLPVLYIDTEIPKDEIGKEVYVFGEMRLAYGDGSGDFSYSFEEEKNGEKKEGIKGYGNATWEMDKKGYDIKFDKKQELFGLAAANEWCIMANYADKTLLRSVYASLLARDIFNAEWNPSFHPVEVVWDGVYQGNYILCEKNTIGGGRVNVQNISDYSGEAIGNGDFVNQNDDDVIDLYDGGFLLEIDDLRDAEFWFETEKAKAPVALKDPDDVSEDIQEHVKDLVQTAENALYSDDFEDAENGWRKYFDENSVIDWFLVNEIARNHDAKDTSSIYKFYKPDDAKLHYGPIWDFDVGFGNDGEGNTAAVTGWYVKNGFWTSRMFEDSRFVSNVIDRWNEKKEALDASVEDLLTLAGNNSVSAKCNFMKWDILGKDIYHNSAGFEERLTYESEVEYMKTWLEDRIAWIDAALNNTYFISYDLDGGSLPASNPDMFLSGDTEEFQLNNPVKEGYVFAGWSGKGIDGMSETVRLTDDHLGDREYKANWRTDLSSGKASLAKSEFIYSGAELKPGVVVSLNDETLTPEKDYVVSYENNINVGLATVTITGAGDYCGILEMTFKISPAPQTITASNFTKPYGNAAFNLNAKSNGDGALTYESSNTKVAVVSTAGKVTIKGAGTANITISASATTNYKAAAKTISVTINKAANTLKIKAKTATVKGSTKGKKGTLKKTKTLGVTKVIKFTSKGQGAKTYVKKSGNKKITIAKKTGKVTVKKGLKKGTYSVKVKVKAAGTANYKASAWKVVTFTIKVR